MWTALGIRLAVPAEPSLFHQTVNKTLPSSRNVNLRLEGEVFCCARFLLPWCRELCRSLFCTRWTPVRTPPQLLPHLERAQNALDAQKYLKTNLKSVTRPQSLMRTRWPLLLQTFRYDFHVGVGRCILGVEKQIRIWDLLKAT